MIWIVLVVCILLACNANAKTKKPSADVLKNIYLRFISSNISSPNAYYMIDLNKDGIKECLVDAGEHYRSYKLFVLTYKKNKVITILDTWNQYDVLFNKGKCQICLGGVTGAASYGYKVYTIKSISAVKTVEYRKKENWRDYSMHYYKGEKEISEKSFRSFEKKLKKWKNIDPMKNGEKY